MNQSLNDSCMVSIPGHCHSPPLMLAFELFPHTRTFKQLWKHPLRSHFLIFYEIKLDIINFIISHLGPVSQKFLRTIYALRIRRACVKLYV